MRKSGFYPRLAWQNITKNRRFYLPYMLACTGCAAMFYILMLLSHDAGVASMYGGRTLQEMLRFGVVVIGLFSAILIFYTNGFLMKRRRRELGLWNILGMEKRHIARVLLLETFFIFLLCLAAGLGAGMLLSKLLSLLLFRLTDTAAPFGMLFSTPVCAVTAIVFGVIFTLVLLFNLLQIRLARPVELLSSGKVAEKQPKTRWFLTLVGLLTMGGGYAIALTVKDPLSAVALFFVAVLLVIVGTYCLFTAGSIAVLKAMRRNKKYYYQTKHFTAVSGMLHRMKQNAAGLASICILCTMILVTVSTTVSLYSGLEDILQTQYPNDVTVTVTEETEADGARCLAAVESVVERSGLQATVTAYSFFPMDLLRDGNAFTDGARGGFTAGEQTVVLIPWADFAPYADGLTARDGAPLLWSQRRPLGEGPVTVLGVEFTPQLLEEFPLRSDVGNALNVCHYLVVTAHDQALLHEKLADYYDGFSEDYYRYEIDVNAEGTTAQLLALSGDVDEVVRIPHINTWVDSDGNTHTDTYYSNYVSSRADGRMGFQTDYGGFLFLGLFLGALFLMATVLIIYYKQISEGYEDKERFAIMQQVGLSRAEIKSTIRSQVLTVFFLPICVAFLHVCGAFKMISLLLSLFSLTNIGLFMACTAGTMAVFALVYGGVYALTARSYYKIVS